MPQDNYISVTGGGYLYVTDMTFVLANLIDYYYIRSYVTILSFNGNSLTGLKIAVNIIHNNRVPTQQSLHHLKAIH